MLLCDGDRKLAKTYLFGTPMLFPHVLPTLQPLQYPLHSRFFLLQLLHFQTLPTSSRLFLQILQGLFHELNIFDPQLLADNVKISDRVDVPLDVNDFSIVETSHDLEDGVDCSDVRQEGISQACAC